MPSELLRLIGRPGLTTRIAVTIIAALLITQTLSIFLLLTLPAGELPLYRVGDIVDHAVRAVRLVTAADQNNRLQALNNLPPLPGIEAELSTTAPIAISDRSLPGIERVRATVQSHLGTTVRQVTASLLPLQTVPPPMKIWVRLITASGSSGADGAVFAADDLNTPLPGVFQLGIELLDHSWLLLTPRIIGTHPLAARNLVPMLVGAGLIVALLSAWTSRRLLEPLGRLVVAVQNMGRARQVAPIAVAGLAEFGVIAEALNAMQARLMRFVAERTQMLAAISHDLRTPLTRMRLLSEYLPDADQKAELQRDIDEMEQMIDATLNFAAQDAASEPRQPTDIAALLISLCDGWSDRSGIAQYTGPDHLVVSVQPIAIKRAFSNLIDNAVRYGGAAYVLLEVQDHRISVLIRDDGPGIAADKIEIAFAPFRRLEASRNRNTGGVGLGLTIARDVIVAHAGDIALAAAEPHGLIVTVTLPQSQQDVANSVTRAGMQA